MTKEKIKTVNGVVLEALPNTTFKVRLEETGEEVLTHLSGKMRKFRIKVLIGDKVQAVFSQYGGVGRIIKRL